MNETNLPMEIDRKLPLEKILNSVSAFLATKNNFVFSLAVLALGGFAVYRLTEKEYGVNVGTVAFVPRAVSCKGDGNLSPNRPEISPETAQY
jgi:hypothetical protein